MEARLQGVARAGTHSLRGWAAMLFSVTEVFDSVAAAVVTVSAVVTVWFGPV